MRAFDSCFCALVSTGIIHFAIQISRVSVRPSNGIYESIYNWFFLFLLFFWSLIVNVFPDFKFSLHLVSVPYALWLYGSSVQ